MRVERFRIDCFGRLKDVDTGSDPLPGLVAVMGPNEVGKSTIFHLLTSLLYGFYPASREANPYAPWDGSDLAGGMSLKLDAGGSVEVERRLLSQPSGRVTGAGVAEELRNRTLPWAEHVPRAVFLQVFALTLDEMAGLEDDTWARIQDRIVGAMGAADVLPARQVVSDLEQAAGELWRPNRRGNQRIRAIQTAILELRERRRSSAERDRTIREAVAELQRVRDELQVTRGERNLVRAGVERIQALVPLRHQLRRIASLREEAGPLDFLAGMPDDPPGELVRIRHRLRDLGTRLEETRGHRAEPDAAVMALGEAERLLLERSADISALVARAAGLRGDRTRLAGLEQEIRDLQRRLDAQSTQLLKHGWTSDLEASLSLLPTADVRERIRRARAAAEEVRVLQAASGSQVPAARGPAAPATLAGSLLVLVSGLILLLFGAMGGGLLATAAGSAASAVGLAFLLLWWLGRRAAGPDVTAGTPLDQRIRQATDAAEKARSAVAEILAGVPVAEGLLEEPDETLAVGLERLQEILRDLKDRARVAGDLQTNLDAADADARGLAGRLGLGRHGDTDATVRLLDQALRRAENLSQAAAAAERELLRLDREEGRLQRDAEAETAKLEDLAQRLAEAGQGDVDQGARSVHARIQARDRADKLEEELERAHPDLDEARARIGEAERNGDSWTVDDTDLARRKAQVEELTERVEALATRAEALDRDIAHLQEGETADVVDGEIASLLQEEALLLRERDRLWVLAQVLKEADRRFREEHQPDLLRRAGGHLSLLTAGRYDRILVDESGGGERFHLGGPWLPEPVPMAPPVSRGTLEQAYLALRLAIVDHLDQGLEKLPLFVDEVLVNWDERRRRCGIELLAAMSRHRQIFVFTCHGNIADELAAAGARVLDLGGGGTL
ncbi:MAG TPA: AAA family ATPase [Longimicrobiales bacterium]|nr:AAA family ATPase [Longimicrobiales bacterium]